MLPLLLAAVLLGPIHESALHPYQEPAIDMAAPAVALARDAQGVAIAWSMPNAAGIPRIHVARLDRFGRMGEIRELPVVLGSGRTAALHPSLSARIGADGFLATWLEEPGNHAQAAYALLDAALVPATPALLPGAKLTTPPMARTAEAMWITSAGSAWRIEPDGSRGARTGAQWPASDMTVLSGVPRMVSSATDARAYRCREKSGCKWIGIFTVCLPDCVIPTPWYDLRLDSKPFRFDFSSDAQPAIAHDGDDLLVTWFRGKQGAGGDVVLASIGPAQQKAPADALQAPRIAGRFEPDSGLTRPDTAVTAQGTFIVWRTTSPLGDHDIAGALLRRDGTVEQFTIAASAADERDPSVLPLENGGALVAWRKIEDRQSRIAWRVIGSQARRRAVR